MADNTGPQATIEAHRPRLRTITIALAGAENDPVVIEDGYVDVDHPHLLSTTEFLDGGGSTRVCYWPWTNVSAVVVETRK